MAYTIGVDTGGTFTDTVVIDESGAQTVAKASTTPGNPVEGVINSVTRAADELDMALDELLPEISAFYHGTTLVTNAMIEMDGSEVGYVTTKGFPDEIHIAQTKSRHAGLSRDEIQHYAMLDKPEPIVEKPFVREVTERTDYKGAEIVPLDEDEAREAVRGLLDDGVESIAVNFLWSFVDPTHERRVAEIIEEEAGGDASVSLSSEISPRLGEYSRGATTLVNSYTRPLFSSYCQSLVAELEANGLDAPIYLMQSNGGIVHIAEAQGESVKAIGSGPVAGVAGSEFLGGHLGRENVICTDVGGTSFDVGMVIDGDPKTVTQQVSNKYTLHQTAVDIESIGSGGGSIAWVDDTNQLHVGPESASADPGPACYGLGGERPTVTDADLILGYIDADYFLGGDQSLDVDRAREAMRTHVAEPMGVDVEEAAAGVFRIVNSHMGDLLHKITIERGYDPQQFEVFAYGGAGPLHASFYSEPINVDSVVVPLSEVASVYSAFGITTTDLTRVEEVTNIINEPFDPDEINAAYDGLIETTVDALVEGRDASPDDVRINRSADMRYSDQVNELEVPLPDGSLTAAEAETLGDRFEEVYKQRYSEAAIYGGSEIEMVTPRVTGRLPTSSPKLGRHDDGGAPGEVWKTRDVYWPNEEGFVETDIYDERVVVTGTAVEGPAVIQLPETTVTVRPHQTARIDEYRNIIIQR